jgi:hypothetical protein
VFMSKMNGKIILDSIHGCLVTDCFSTVSKAYLFL